MCSFAWLKVYLCISRESSSFLMIYWIIGIKHGFLCINICQVPREVLNTEVEDQGFQLFPRDRANVKALEKHVRLLLLH